MFITFGIKNQSNRVPVLNILRIINTHFLVHNTSVTINTCLSVSNTSQMVECRSKVIYEEKKLCYPSLQIKLLNQVEMNKFYGRLTESGF